MDCGECLTASFEAASLKPCATPAAALGRESSSGKARFVSIRLRGFAQQPPQPLLHHVIIVLEQQVRKACNLRKEQLPPRALDQGYAGGSAMPAIGRFCPVEHFPR